MKVGDKIIIKNIPNFTLFTSTGSYKLPFLKGVIQEIYSGNCKIYFLKIKESAYVHNYCFDVIPDIFEIWAKT